MRTPDEEDATNAYVGKRIRSARNEVGMSQGALGGVLGVTFQQVQKMEKGVNRVSVGRLQQISTTVNKPIAWFLPDSKQVPEVIDAAADFFALPHAAEVAEMYAKLDVVERAHVRALMRLLNNREH